MRRRICVISWFLCLFFFVPALLLTAFDLAVLDNGVHMGLYEQFGSAGAAGLSSDALYETSRAIVEYLQGKKAELSVTAVIGGEEQPVFNQRELVHMGDVRALFDLSRRVRVFFLGGALCCLAAALLLRKKSPPVFKLGAIASSIWIAALGAVIAFAALDFSRAFDLFHRLLFTNDLWQLDPNTDRMIRMMPEPFFGALATRAALFMGAALLTYLAVLFVIQRAARRCVK